MKYENLKFDIEDSIGRITLNRPNSANAITIPLVKELLDVAIRCESCLLYTSPSPRDE